MAAGQFWQFFSWEMITWTTCLKRKVTLQSEWNMNEERKNLLWARISPRVGSNFKRSNLNVQVVRWHHFRHFPKVTLPTNLLFTHPAAMMSPGSDAVTEGDSKLRSNLPPAANTGSIAYDKYFECGATFAPPLLPSARPATRCFAWHVYIRF